MRASDSSAAQKANSSDPRSVFFLQFLALCFEFDFFCPFLTWSLTFCRSSSRSARVTYFFFQNKPPNHRANHWLMEEKPKLKCLKPAFLLMTSRGRLHRFTKRSQIVCVSSHLIITSVNTFLMISWPLSLVLKFSFIHPDVHFVKFGSILSKIPRKTFRAWLPVWVKLLGNSN